ncbi:MAG TPA: YebC/PmpR family DNA-binding transcriptional regulator [Rhodospirillaceae bacterium]|nr:YebC/PmpR family DNA-binding transcriptional regulator [Rhodospirillaceae bacterium]
MAGHSHAKNVMHQKNASDSKKAKIFNKLAREIMVSVKLGAPDPASNPRLRAALAEARVKNMTRDRIERAIKSGQPDSDDKAIYEEVRYEAYGPGGSALIIEGLTDNRNRTAAEVRTAISKNGGNLAETGSVSFMFDRVGEIVYPASKGSPDDMLEIVIEAGGNDVESDDENHYIFTGLEDFGTVRAALEKELGEPSSAKLVWTAKNDVPVAGQDAQTLLKVLDLLEDNDDVQNVFGNYDISEEDQAAYKG